MVTFLRVEGVVPRGEWEECLVLEEDVSHVALGVASLKRLWASLDGMNVRDVVEGRHSIVLLKARDIVACSFDRRPRACDNTESILLLFLAE